MKSPTIPPPSERTDCDGKGRGPDSVRKPHGSICRGVTLACWWARADDAHKKKEGEAAFREERMPEPLESRRVLDLR